MATDYSLLTLAQVKEYLGITDTANDATIEKMLPVVTQWFENYCSRGLAFLAGVVEEVWDYSGNELFLSRFPIASVASVIVEGGGEISDYKINKRQGYLLSSPYGFYAPRMNGLQIVVTYDGGYPDVDVPSDLGMAFANCVAVQAGLTPAGVGVAAPIKQLGLGSGALSIGFDTGSTAGGTTGGYNVSGVPPMLQPFAATLDRYKAREVA